MGCDIHIVIQRQNSNGDWREVPYQHLYSFMNQTAIPDIPVSPDHFASRNYNLFGILADVRNGRGFAGIETGLGWPSIAPDRGFPDGFDSEKVLPNPQYVDEGPRGLGDHSFTWVTLDELKAFPWDSTVTTLFGVVSAEVYERLAVTGDTPNEWSGGISGLGIQVYQPTEYLTAKRNGTLVPKPYVRMSWHESARSATGDWPGHVIPWLEQLADGRPLRLVIGFDS